MRTWAEQCCEVYRLGLMRGLEDELARAGFPRVAGVDEAGRGCLAGPVVAAAFLPDPDRLVPGVDDSKRLEPEARAALAAALRATAIAHAVVAVPAETIDRVNILEATRIAMRDAIGLLAPAPDLVVTDAVALAGLACPCLPVVRGDALSYAVAGASILAKTERDRLMRRLDRQYPHYGFAAHKGYAAPGHLAALARFGPSSEHRLTFARVVPRLERRAG
ncbi:MAG: ribonuclease HII [Thermoanaerobaculia bacterium]